MKVELLYIADCPNHAPARAALDEAIRIEQVEVEVSELEIKDEYTSRAIGFMGSPSIRVNGDDIDPGVRGGIAGGLCCRTYSESGAPKGVPSLEMIRQALRNARETRVNHRRTLFAGVGAIVSVVAASSCCLPLLPFLAAAGFAGGSAFLALLRPYLLAVSVLLVAFGFYQARRARQCNCRPSLLSSILLWSSAVIVFVSIFFPQAMASLLAG